MLLVTVSILSVQVGAAVAKGLFGVISPTAMVWLRLLTSTLVLLAWARPRLRGRTPTDWAVVSAFGLSLVTMNWAIYLSFSRIPLGMAVTIEFLGPLAIAVIGSRRARDFLWVLLAAIGVALLGFTPSRFDLVGVAYALLAGVAWAAYILLSGHTGKRWEGLSGLSLASLVAVAVITGPALAVGGSSLWQPHVLAIGAAVGLLSSVIPYSLEITALRTMPSKVFGILMSLEPAAAALAGLVLIGERLSWVEVAAMACVVVASVGATRSA
ncbi:DMT family transporter [Mariniluteicoccus endophyticus]